MRKVPLKYGILILVIFSSVIIISQISSQSPRIPSNQQFQKGMAFPTWQYNQYSSPDSDKSLKILKRKTCTEWVQFVPTWYQEDKFSNKMSPDSKGMTASKKSLRHAIRTAHNLGLKVMLKPHVDAFDGSWRGTFQPTDPEAWFKNYRKMMRNYARLAQKENVEILSIGCEFIELTKSEFTGQWSRIVRAFKKYYKGPLVYSANWWQEYVQVEFWGELDYIGIDAYFMLTNKTDPSLEELLTSWKLYFTQIETFYQGWKIPVILTEIGYRSIDGANMRPWDWEITGTVDLEEQALCYQAVIETFKGKPWFKGIYWWNWEPDPSLGGPDDNGYTPYKKPAEKIVKNWYCE